MSNFTYDIAQKTSFFPALFKNQKNWTEISSGATLWGAMKLSRSLEKPARIVTIFPGGASRYLSTIFNDAWLKEKGFL
ncbi:MAG TPA: hypothetical protein PKU99_02250 [Candidatus Saccharicenans sp.]|jgi:cysteine synthase|nr:hypothetical protein [Candidatus Saccharicenans sp.]